MEYARDLVGGGEIGVNKVCQLFKISKKTYYQCKDPIERLSRKYLSIKEAVRKVIKDNPKYGVLRIKAELKRKYSILIGRDILAKLLNIWGLELKRKVRKSKPSFIRKILIKLSWKANLLIREKIERPFQAVTSDISEIRFNGGKAYLCIHKDVYGQRVYGWSLSLSQDLKLVRDSFQMAQRELKRLGLPTWLREKIIWHQDQGSQYTSYWYIQEVLKIGRISFSQKGTPTDNPGQESFFGRLKEESNLEFLECRTFEELRDKIKEKIEYYDSERIHTSIGYQPPKSFTESYLKSKLKWFTRCRG